MDNYNDFSGASKWDKTRRIKRSNVISDVTLATPFACCKVTGSFPNVTPVDENCAVSPTVNNSNYLSVSIPYTNRLTDVHTKADRHPCNRK